MTAPDGRRLLLVHAHPDDESIGTGATMAKYAAEGAHVNLVTCTLGELGEVIRRTWPTWPGTPMAAWASTGSASWRPPAPRSASPTTASSAGRAGGVTPG